MPVDLVLVNGNEKILLLAKLIQLLLLLIVISKSAMMVMLKHWLLWAVQKLLLPLLLSGSLDFDPVPR